MFYKKLVIPALSMSAAIASIAFFNSGGFSFKWFGISYLIVTPLFQYYIYGIRNPNEYYFYYNMGMSKPILWLATIVFSSFIGLLIRLI
ncbi:MAG TPA: hypothetical protein VFC67_16830 [Prolixibacteraceae bacterium]|nr:hypothetical protein [Prolixibacteraceae bacterium]